MSDQIEERLLKFTEIRTKICNILCATFLGVEKWTSKILSNLWYTGQLQLISPPLKEENSDFQINSGENSFWGK